ncbi:AI-2E family transporter [Comamonas sp. JC664]|uniref:AI-2E family transporter n=1 Tax=Comamonas sp. JC664 TaxID=2801917 RepID=UPI001748BD30|nr:AI-2E family transporter [Comamonas sp. JC664]MBL0695038.1 AI-2E family transporter [Comamonas sp. JC664]GHH02777.1 AI-2E family transporter [Comamonas sp. KCTC 72670]
MATLDSSSHSWLTRSALFSGKLIVIAGAVVALVLLLARLYLIVLPSVVALLLATLLYPPVRWLSARKVPRALATLLAVLVLLLVAAAVFLLLVPRIVQEVSAAGSNMQAGLEGAIGWLTQELPVSREQLDGLLQEGLAFLKSNAGRITSGVLAGANFAVQAMAGGLLTLTLLFFFVKDAEQLGGWVLARVSPSRRETVRAVGLRAWRTLSGYLRGVVIIAMVDAVGIGVGLAIIGVPLVLPLAALTFMGGFFPIVGATVAGFIAVLVALITSGPLDALLALGIVLGVQQLESNVLEPVVMGRAVPLHPVVILLSITAGGVLFGVAGAFLSVPVAAVLSAVGNELRLRNEARVIDQPSRVSPP